MRLPRIALCGPSRCGKDEAASWLAQNTPIRYARGMSRVIMPHAGKRLRVSEEQAYAERHQHRQLWFDVGNELRAKDPAFLVRECLKDGEIVVGLRNEEEVEVSRDLGLVDLVCWIDRDVPEDPTMQCDHSLCDLVVINYGAVHELHEKMRALARFAQLMG